MNYISKTLFFLILTLLTTKVQATAPLCHQTLLSSMISERTEAQIELSAQWTRLDVMRSERNKDLRRQAKRVSVAAQAVLAEKGIQYELDPENSMIILIKVPALHSELQTASTFNRLAYRLYHQMGIKDQDGFVISEPLRIEINPLMLKQDLAGALFDENRSRLTLARDNVLTGLIDDMVIHELRHGYSFYLQGNGVDHDFTAWIRYDEKLPPIHETYPYVFSADEFPAYIKQIALQIRKGKKDPNYIRYARQFTKVGLTLVQAYNRPELATQAGQIIQNLASQPQAWSRPRWTEEKVGGSDLTTRVLMLNQNGARARIYFYEKPLLESLPKQEKKITCAVLENGPYSLEMQTLLPLTEQNLAPLVTTIQTKVRNLTTRTIGIEEDLVATQQALDKGDLEAALLSIEKALGLIQIKP